MRRLTIAATAALLLALAGCSAVPASDRPVVTTNILGDLVTDVVGAQADVTVLMPPETDPHSVEVSAREAAGMLDAGLVVSNGLGLEEGLQRHVAASAEAGVPQLVVGDAIEAIDYAEGDSAGTPDPHFWTDPARMLDALDALEPALAAVSGIDGAALAADAERVRAELVDLDAWMAAEFATIPEERRVLVTNHHVFGYLAERFDFRVVGAVIPGGTTLASPSAADLDDLADAIEEAGVPTIFAESSQPDRLVQVLAAEAGVDVEVAELFTESLTSADGGAATYLDMQRANTGRITAGLSS